MGRSLHVFVFSFWVAWQPARAGSQDILEPYQVLDVRMEEGVKDAAATKHYVDDAKSTFYSAAFLAGQDTSNLDIIASRVATQRAEATRLSDMLDQFNSV